VEGKKNGDHYKVEGGGKGGPDNRKYLLAKKKENLIQKNVTSVAGGRQAYKNLGNLRGESRKKGWQRLG